MKIYVSNEIIDNVKENHDDVSIHLIAYDYEDMEINSLEQHEAEIKKPLEDKIQELIKSKNEQENILLDKIIKLQKQLKQERQKVIAELEEWVDTCHLVESIYEGVYCIDKDDLKQKLKEMKENINE